MLRSIVSQKFLRCLPTKEKEEEERLEMSRGDDASSAQQFGHLQLSAHASWYKSRGRQFRGLFQMIGQRRSFSLAFT